MDDCSRRAAVSQMHLISTIRLTLSEARHSAMRSSVLTILPAAPETLLLAAVALCFLVKLYGIAYTAIMDGVASSLQSAFQEAEDDAYTEILNGAVQYFTGQTESMFALRGCAVQLEEYAGLAVRSSGTDQDQKPDGSEMMTCAVCLSEMRWQKEEVGQLQCCGHVFHRGCIHAWLRGFRHRSSATCPLCRAHVFSRQVY